MAIGHDERARASSDEKPGAFDDEITRPESEWPVPREYATDAPPPSTEAVTRVEPTGVVAPGSRKPRRPLGWPRENHAGLLALLLLAAVLVSATLLLMRDGSQAASGRPADGDGSGAAGALLPPRVAGTNGGAAQAPPTISVPDVEGDMLSEATRALRKAGLREQVRRSESDNGLGVVLEQAPRAGEATERGSRVLLIVSSGPPAAVLPDVVGLAAADAMRAIRDEGLQPRLRLVRSAERAGTVLAQQPVSGGDVERGSVVTLRVAKVPPRPVTVEVPRLVGSTAGEARARLRELGLRSSMTEVVSSKPLGVVVRQSERAGAAVEKGSTVVLEVSSGPGLVSVPDVIGLDVVSARHELEAAGFTVVVVHRPTADPAEEGVVLDQAPYGGGRAGHGATVTVTVGLHG